MFMVEPLAELYGSAPEEALARSSELVASCEYGSQIVAQVLAQRPEFLEMVLDAGILREIAKGGNHFAAQNLAFSVFRHESPSVAVAVVLELDLAVSSRVAEMVAMILVSDRRSGRPIWTLMTPDQRSDIVDRLVQVPDIRDYHIESLMNLQIAIDARVVAEFLKRRVELVTDEGGGYEAIPFGWESKIHFDKCVEQAAIIRDLVDWYATLGTARQRFEARELLEMSAVGFGPSVREVLVALVRDCDAAHAEAVQSVLAAAPRDFVFSEYEYVRELGELATRSSAENLEMVTYGLLESAIPSFGSRTVGEADPADIERVRKSEEVLARCARDAPLRPLYEKIKRRSEANLVWQEEADRDFMEPRKW
jgi:hypothetical protein